MAALGENPSYHLQLTDGNKRHATGGVQAARGDYGMIEYLNTIASVRDASQIPICVEASPPCEDEVVETLVRAGVNAFSINLEIWDDDLRKSYCPGKSRIPVHRYIEIWERALAVLGPNMVASVRIARLESKESTLAGARELAKIGVIPTIMPLRNNDGSQLPFPGTCDPEDIIWISERVGELLDEHGMQPWRQPGCTACGACSLEQDYQRERNGAD
jgi:biotin synthase-related radical SAM superfamily protein